MALSIVFVNISNLAPISTYKYGVFINDHEIARGKVTGHNRADGWASCVGLLLDQRQSEGLAKP